MTTSILASFPSPPQGVWHLGPLPIRAYALFIILGIIAALMIGDRRWEARGGERGVIYDIALWAVPFGLIGGRLYHLMTDWRTYFGDGGAGPMAALRIWDGGLGIWGAVALGGVGAWIACRKRDIPLPAFGDAIAPGIILAQAIGRIGNYFNQELFGRETTMPWGLEIFFRRDSAGFVDVHSLDGVSTGRLAMVVQPTFLYELLWNLLIFGVLLIVDRRFTIGHGRLFALYVAGYCVGRFGIELLRDDTATQIAGIRINSFTSMFVLIGAVVYVLVAPKGREDPATLSGSAAELLEPDSPDDEATASSSSRLADAIAAADAVFDRDAPAAARNATPEADAGAVAASTAEGSGVRPKTAERASRARFGSALKTWLAERKAQLKKSPAPKYDARPDKSGDREQDIDADRVDSDAAETDAFAVWVNDASQPAGQEDAEPASSTWFASATRSRHAERKAEPKKSPAPNDDAVVRAVSSRPTPDDTISDVAPAQPDEPEDHEQGVQADAVVVDSDAGEAYASGVGANEALEQTVVHKAEPASGARIGSILKWRPGSRKAEPAKGSPAEDEAVVSNGPDKSNFMTGVAASRLRERAEAEAGFAARATTAGAEASGRATEAAAVARVAENTTDVVELAEALKHASNEADAAVARAKRSAETARRAVGEAEAEVAHRVSAVGERVQAAKRDVDVAEAAVAKALESADAARRAVGDAEALVVRRVSEAEAIAEIVQRSIAAGSVADATKRAAEEAGAQASDQVTEARAAVDRAARVAAEALADVGARETAARKAKRAADHANADAARHVGEARAAVDRAARMAADAEAEISSREAAAAEAKRAADDAAVGAAQRMAEEAENKVAKLQGKAEAARRAIAEAEAEAARRAEGAAAAAEDARRAADAEVEAAQHATDTKATAETAREQAHAAEAEIGRFASEARAAAEIAEHAAEAAGAQAAKRVADAVTALEEAVKAADEAQAVVATRAAEADALTGIVKQAEAAGPIAQAALRAAQEAEAEARKQVDDAQAAAATANHVVDEADADLARHRAAADFARSSGPEAEAAKRAADAHRAASARAADARAAADAAERTAAAAGSAVVRSVAEARVAATAANHAAVAETEARQRVAEAHAAAEAAHRKASEAEEDFARHSAAADAAKRGATERVF